MSLLVNGISPLPVGSLCFKQNRGSSMLSVRKQVRMMSSSSSSSSKPYLIFDEDWVGETRFGNKVVSLSMYDPGKRVREDKTWVEIPDQTSVEYLNDLRIIGTSRGWVAQMHGHDFTVSLTDMYNPIISSSPKLISLPPLVNTLIEDEEDRDYVCNVSLSCHPEHENCVLAVKFLGPYMSLCRLGDTKWTHVKTNFDFDESLVVYSKRDQMFYLNALSESRPYTWLIRSNDTKSLFPPVVLRTLHLPNLTESMRRELNSGYSYLIESPTGKFFSMFLRLDKSARTKSFIVFGEDMLPTQDIGDVCVFLGWNEPFCVPASMYPGLVPNSIYFAFDKDVGIYDLASGTIYGLDTTDVEKFWLEPRI